jgi:UDP-N-acetylmuramate: L-alanyl-gamma-D-glutamyl-meso-diaminopimelate ligase
LKATVQAVKDQFQNRELVAVMELHTFSSLKKEFLAQYKGTMESADQAFVYFNPLTIEHKRLDPITVEEVEESFDGNNLEVYTDSDLLFEALAGIEWKGKNLLIMSSGDFSGKDIKEFGKSIL